MGGIKIKQRDVLLKLGGGYMCTYNDRDKTTTKFVNSIQSKKIQEIFDVKTGPDKDTILN